MLKTVMIRGIFMVLLSTVTSFAQSTRTEDSLASELFYTLTHNDSSLDSLFISLQDYHRLIDRQRLSSGDRSQYKSEINNSYSTLEYDFIESVKILRTVYSQEILRNVKIEIKSSTFHPVPQTVNIYEMVMVLTLQEEDEAPYQVEIDAMVANVKLRYSIITPVNESYPE